MKCMHCGFENPEMSKFCGKCGKALGREKISTKKVIVALMAIGILILIYLALNTAPTSPVLTTISVSPPTVSVDEGKTYNFFSLSQDQFGKTMAVKVIWASSDTSVGPIDNNGVFTAKTPGSTIITATSGSVSGKATAKVTLPESVLATITVSPATVSLMVGNKQSFSSSLIDQFGKTTTGTIKWTSSDINVGTIDSNGIFTAKESGTTIITASSGAVSKTAIVTVTTPTGFRIVEAILGADPSNYAGACPIQITFSGRISVAGGSGTVSYRFIRNDGASGPVNTLTFTSPGSQDVNTTWYMGGTGTDYSGWEAIKILDPQEVESPHANFMIRCNP